MKIALINPPYLFPSKSQCVFSHCLGLRSMSSFLKEHGHEVVFIDALIQGFSHIKKYTGGFQVGLSYGEISARIPPDTDIVGVSVPFSQLAPIAHDLLDNIKITHPAIKTVMGGVYPSTQPELALTSAADHIVISEGEKPLLALADGEAPAAIRGLYSRGVEINDGFQRSEFIEDLDTLPFSDYSIPDIDRYFSLSPRMRAGRTASIVTSRGCPFACEFCSIHPIYGRKYRFRSAGNVLEEISYLVERHKIDTLEIEDDNFTLHKERTVEVLEGIIRLNENGAKLRWRTPNGIRIDSLDDEVIGLIRRADCSEITLALEHGDREMLQIMNKRLELDKAFEVIQTLIKHRMKIIIFVIVGYPDETRARFDSGLKFLERVKSLNGEVTVLPNIAQPYPGTRLLQRCREEGLIKDEHYDNFLYRRDLMSTGRVSIDNPALPAAEVYSRRRRLLFLFTPWWIIVARNMMLILPSWLVAIIRRLRRK